ncbi:PVC-type heme-binding CxxCH protein [Planctomycetes bacterium K23_9]|uniref:Cytochrome c n=1 Tax=Stieleria marina TaxID=1930275 RepID=A0A517NRA0_9BACT|nr:Cytochrome c [Planctomycetes bacterium K23_9]
MKYSHLVPAIVLLLFFVDATCVSAVESPVLRAGAASVDISPETLPAIQNGGFLQRSVDRVLDPLHARSLVLSDAKETIAIVIVDSCMCPTTVCDEIKRLASKETGIPTNRILISATHTHMAPSVMERCLGSSADDAYVKFVPARVAQSIVEAHQNLQAAKIGWSIVDGADLTNCRRWITRSDKMGTDPFGRQTVRAMMHPGYQNPNYTSPAGPIDPWLSVLSVVSAKDDSPICVMGNLSMHYFGGAGFSADYFGEVARILQMRVGKDSGTASAGVVGIMSQGTSGDLHWMDYSKPRQGIKRQEYSQRVADRVLEAWKTIEHRSDHSLAMAEKRLTIDRRTPSQDRRQWARPINAGRGNLPPRNRAEVYAQQAQWIHKNPKAEVVLQAVRIGELGITAIPNEVYGITGLKLKRQSPLKATFNLELANGAAGYIPPPEQHRLGGYTTWPARTAGLDEQAEPLIVETLLSLLETVAEKKRRELVHSDTPYAQAVTSRKPIAYWRLDEMVSTQAKDSVAENHAQYRGGVALFLPGPDGRGFDGPGFESADYGNRSVYLAGGHVDATLNHAPGNSAGESPSEYSLAMWFLNALPADTRDTTGVLLSTGSETLLIAGTDAGDQLGKLVLHSGQHTFVGKTPLSTQHWQQVTITRDKQRVRVYLDGRAEPEIDAEIGSPKPIDRLLIGSDGTSAATFDGKVDEVALFDRVLAADDIVEMYKASGMTAPPTPKPTIVLGPKPTDDDSRRKYADVILSSKPVAFWRLHDQLNQTAKDSAGPHDANYEPGALPFQAGAGKQNFTGGRVKASLPKLHNTYSVELWCRNELPVDSRPVAAYLFSRAIDGVEGAFGDNLGIGGTHSNMGRLIVFNGNKRSEMVAGHTRIPMGSWSHVVMVRQQQRITVYLNGDPTPEIAADLPVGYPEGCNELLIGGRTDNFANLQGMLEEVALYDRALTPQEVAAHFGAAGAKQVSLLSGPETKPGTKNDNHAEPTPTEVGKALQTIHVPNGFEVQLVAAEPLVMDPVAIDWGPDGKLWVVEMADYPLGMDGQGQSGGRVRFLEDTDDDGRYDKSTLFAQGLSFPTGVLAWGQGILVTAAPQIVYLEDRSGDGKADVRKVLYSGFLEGNQQLRVNGLRYGLDNWVYCASGSHHGGYGKDSQITSHLTETKQQVGSRDFRIRPDTGAIDPQSGPSQYGRNRDDWGNWFGVQNSHPLWHYVLADHHIRRNPHFAPPDPKHQVVTPSNPRVYPASQLQKRFHNFTQSGRFTSACSAMIYRDDHLFDSGNEQHAFTCEPFHNLVQHNLIAEDGVSFKFRRDPAEHKLDFFTSEDRWCRPVMARTGPDGALWVVDMYRYMIEHPQWLPKNGQDELRPWFRSGENRGRIYRVVRSDAADRKIPRLANLSAQALVAALESPNGWQRDTAQRLMVRGKHQAATRPLKDMVANSEQPLARLHALWTLDGLNALSTNTLQTALTDTHPGVRRNAVRIAAQHKVNVDRLASLVDDPDAKVRLELATALGAYDSPPASAALAKIVSESGDDRYLRAAVMSSLKPQNVFAVLTEVYQSPKRTGTESITHNTSELITQTVAMGDKETIGQLVELVIGRELETKGKLEALGRILDGLRSRKMTLAALPGITANQIESTIQQARVAVTDQRESVGVRIASASLLGREQASRQEDFKLMQELLVPQSPVLLQRAVVAHLARRSEDSVGEILLAGWRSHSPELRSQILDVLASRPPWAESLRGRLEAGTIGVSELSATVRQRFLDRSKNAPRWQKALASKASTNRADVLQNFQPALKLNGDSTRGGQVFRKSCINCHKVKDEGHEVGPQLASITNKTKEALLIAILDPSASVDAKYFNYSILTEDGQSFSGKLETETGTSITLLAAEGKRKTVLRRDIEILQATSKSIMPEGLEQELKPQDMADLIQFVRETFR